MRLRLWVGLGIGLTLVLVVVGLTLGGIWIGHRLWTRASMSVPARMGSTPFGEVCGGEDMEADTGVMDREAGTADVCPVGGVGGPTVNKPSSEGLTLPVVYTTVERYIARLGYADLSVAEIMEFEHNFYVIVRETDTDIGAMELLVDKRTGIVGPEMGPNMMWNRKYGRHGRGGGMMGGGDDIENVISAAEALEIAQRWLDVHRPGLTVEEHASPFYGYYTIHTVLDGQIQGMLSVHGTTGQVWYHVWHGRFIASESYMEEPEHQPESSSRGGQGILVSLGKPWP